MANINDLLINVNGSLKALKPITVSISKELFDSGLAAEVDSTIVTYGFFTVSDGKEEFECNFPLEVKLNVFDREDSDNVKLIYNTNDIIIDKMVFVSNVKDASKFMGFLTRGAISTSKVEMLVDIFKQNMRMNGINPDIPSELIESMISEMVRWKDNESIPFRIAINNKGVGENDYTIVNIKDIGRLTSVFGAISFEDINKALQASVMMTRTNQEQTPSPLETVLYT